MKKLKSSPELVNSYPYGDGWLFRIKIEDSDEINDLLDAECYKPLLTFNNHAVYSSY